MFSVFVCDACPLAFRVGECACWDGAGRQAQVVCYGCGTMHRLVQKRKGCHLFALSGPVRDEKAAHAPEYEWHLVGEAAKADDWPTLRCAACARVGQLRPRERLPRQSEWPEEPVCPLCREQLRCVSVCIID